MLAEKRYEIILEMLERTGTVTLPEVKEATGASEATIRRDITALHNASKLVKVFGGAISVENNFRTSEATVAQKNELNPGEKQRIGRYAASLIGHDEFVYVDAGTTTAYMLEYVDTERVTYVTNAVDHAKKLAGRGASVIMLGGAIKNSTEAVVGASAVRALRGFNFTKGFFGTNGISRSAGLTTPAIDEAMVKETAIGQCKKVYVLADNSKFNNIFPVTFGQIEDVEILTDKIVSGYDQYDNIVVCE